MKLLMDREKIVGYPLSDTEIIYIYVVVYCHLNKSNTFDPANYRLIALTFNISKVIRTVINNGIFLSPSMNQIHWILTYFTQQWILPLEKFGENNVVALDINRAILYITYKSKP